LAINTIGEYSFNMLHQAIGLSHGEF